MAMVYISCDAQERAVVRVMTAAKDKTKVFDTHPEALTFAASKMGRQGMVLDSYDKELAALRAGG